MLTDTWSSQEAEGTYVLALVPSSGLSGGIEAYADAVLNQVAASGASIERLNLHRDRTSSRPSVCNKLMFALRTLRSARRLRQSPHAILLVFHPSFASLGTLARMLAGSNLVGAHLFLYGRDIWGANGRSRWLWRNSGLSLVTISSYSAGALSHAGPVQVLSPGIVSSHYRSLRAIARKCRQGPGELRVLSVFRLADAEEKGAFRLIEAVDRLRRDAYPIRLTIAGAGIAGSRLLREANQHRDWLALVEGPSTAALHRLYGEADVFVLATGLQTGRRASGEGFGIVLVEAALAGLGVVAPAMGGSADAFVKGITGLSPVDHSIESLTDVLKWCADHPARLQAFGANGRLWASQEFHPDAYRRRVRAVLLEGQGDVSVCRLVLAEGGIAVDEEHGL